jgi:hypothetical protein
MASLAFLRAATNAARAAASMLSRFGRIGLFGFEFMSVVYPQIRKLMLKKK